MKNFYAGDLAFTQENKISYRQDGLGTPHFELCARIIAMAHHDYQEGDDMNKHSAITFFTGPWYELLYDYCSSFPVSASYLEYLRPPKTLTCQK